MRSRPEPSPVHHGHKHDAAGEIVHVTLIGDGEKHRLEVEQGCTVRDVLLVAGLAPSLNIVHHDGRVVPMSAVINEEVELEVTRTASGG